MSFPEDRSPFLHLVLPPRRCSNPLHSENISNHHMQIQTKRESHWCDPTALWTSKAQSQGIKCMFWDKAWCTTKTYCKLQNQYRKSTALDLISRAKRAITRSGKTSLTSTGHGGYKTVIMNSFPNFTDIINGSRWGK